MDHRGSEGSRSRGPRGTSLLDTERRVRAQERCAHTPVGICNIWRERSFNGAEGEARIHLPGRSVCVCATSDRAFHRGCSKGMTSKNSTQNGSVGGKEDLQFTCASEVASHWLSLHPPSASCQLGAHAALFLLTSLSSVPRATTCENPALQRASTPHLHSLSISHVISPSPHRRSAADPLRPALGSGAARLSRRSRVLPLRPARRRPRPLSLGRRRLHRARGPLRMARSSSAQV